MNMGTPPKKPTILLFDNETESKRPLGKLLSEQKVSEEQIEKLRKEFT